MREPYTDFVNIPMKSEMSSSDGSYNLTPNVPMVKHNPVPVKSDPENPMINLSEYQKQLLAEISKRPEILKLFKVIFHQYPTLINREYRLNSPHATNRQRINGRTLTLERLKLEAFIEEEICRIAGIDVNQIAITNMQKPEVTQEEVLDIVEKEVKRTKKKVSKK